LAEEDENEEDTETVSNNPTNDTNPQSTASKTPCDSSEQDIRMYNNYSYSIL